MIIIDKDKYERLLDAQLKQKISDYLVENDEDLKLYIEMVSGRFNLEVEEKLGVVLSPSQVEVRLLSSDPNRLTKDYLVQFKPNKRHIALWDSIEEVIEVPLNFTPPFVTQVPLREPRIETYGQVETSVPYDVIQYFPWGYDLERNVQIWKKN